MVKHVKSSLNRTFIRGTLIEEAQALTDIHGSLSATFALRTSDQPTSKNADKIECIAYGEEAEAILTCGKIGELVLVDGHIESRLEQQGLKRRNIMRISVNSLRFSVNKTFHSGNLVKDPTLFTGPSGKTYALFTLAVNRMGGNVDYIDFIAFKNQAEAMVNYTKSGCGLLIEGRISNRINENNPNSGSSSMRVIAERVQFLDPFEIHVQEGIEPSLMTAQRLIEELV